MAEAAALESQGKLEEAAAKLEMGCALSPTEDPCPGSDRKASETWQKAAEKAVTEGRYRDAERLFQRAALTADDDGRLVIKDRLGKPDVVEGLKYERALAMTDEAAAPVMDGISKAQAPAAEKAKEWLAKKAPPTLTKAVMAACGPERAGSCTKAWEALQAAGIKGPEVDKAQAAAEAEERRVYPLRVQAESFLPIFAERNRKEAGYKTCLSNAGGGGEGSGAEVACFSETYAAPDPMALFDTQQSQDALFRRTLKQIGDDAITSELKLRRAAAEVSGQYLRQEIPKPKPAPKKP